MQKDMDRYVKNKQVGTVSKSVLHEPQGAWIMVRSKYPASSLIVSSVTVMSSFQSPAPPQPVHRAGPTRDTGFPFSR